MMFTKLFPILLSVATLGISEQARSLPSEAISNTPYLAQTELPISEIRASNINPNIGDITIAFIVPTRWQSFDNSAYGGSLTLWDGYVSKMFEITHWVCQNSNLSSRDTLDWRFGAANASSRLRMSCGMANRLANQFGADGRIEQTPVYIRNSQRPTMWEVPIFEISPAEVPAWQRIVRDGYNPPGDL
jgi:hypothetical protein